MTTLLKISKIKHASANTYALTLIFIVLWCVGLINLYSASTGGGFFFTQLKYLSLGGLAFAFFGWVIPLRQVNAYSYIFFGLILICLIVVMVLGHTAGGAQRWMNVGLLKFQPSEFAKLAMALVTAKFFYNNRNKNEYEVWELWPILTTVGFTFLVIFEQPDFGTAGFCLLVAMTQLCFVRINISKTVLASLILSGISAAIVGWTFMLRPYQKLRVLNLVDPHLDPTGSGYNSLQSLVAVGSGGLFGKGFYQGTQAQLQFLPARHTDFIFSVFAEEHGFWGSMGIFLMFGAIAYIALDLARESRDAFSSLLSVGIAAVIFIEFLINVAMVLGIFPVVGIPLPFFSYGGSSLLTVSICMGLLVAIDRDNVRDE